MEFKNAISKIMKDNVLQFMSENGKILSVNNKGEVIVTDNFKTLTVITNEDFISEGWNELLTSKKTFNELLNLHNIYNDIQFQVKHEGIEEDNFKTRTIKYYLNDFLVELTENYSSSEIASILKNVEIFTE